MTSTRKRIALIALAATTLLAGVGVTAAFASVAPVERSPLPGIERPMERPQFVEGL